MSELQQRQSHTFSAKLLLISQLFFSISTMCPVVDIATGAVTRTEVVVVTLVKAHILARLLHGALDTHLLHIRVG